MAADAANLWKTVVAAPWVGANYGLSTLFPYRTLWLGESHYCQPHEYTQDITIRCVRAHVEREERWNLFWTKLRRLVHSRAPISANDFWHGSAFYNFVQFRVSDKARDRPTPAMWAQSVPGLEEVLHRLSPERVIVTGHQLWSSLQDHAAIGSIDRSAVAPMFLPIAHPSSFGFCYEDWRPRVRAFLGLPSISESAL